MLQIRIKNINQTVSFPEGSSLLEVYQGVADKLQMQYPVASAKVNNVSQGLKFRLYHNRDVEFLDARGGSGHRVYVRSLSFVLYKATQDVYPGSKLFIEHALAGGFYCNFKRKEEGGKRKEDTLSTEVCAKIKQRMQEIVDMDMPFRRNEVSTEEAVRIFRDRGFSDKVKLLETSGQVYSDYYTLGETVDYYYGPLVPSAGYLKVWDLEPYADGLLLRVPSQKNPLELTPKTDQPRTFEMFAEKVRWDIIMRHSNAGDVNKAILRGYGSELIQVSEALQEKKIVKIAEEIAERKPRLVLITGPSSSGKTTFCKRLSIQLLACGIRPVSFSTDDYFVNRVETPLLPNGDYDFDNIKTVDCQLLEDHLLRLMKGETVEVPEYNFTTGKREYNGKRMKINDDSILILEGIHALNPILTEKVPDNLKYKVFISALTSISLDDHNWIPTNDNRLLRRIIRDYNKGAFTARETIAQWPNVCEAEEQWITPFQETADVMFNSALNIEFAVLRTHAELILATVPKNCAEYAEAHRLLKFIHYLNSAAL